MTGYPPGLTAEARADGRVWYHGGPGARTGVWLLRRGDWRYWSWADIGDAATDLLDAVAARSAYRRDPGPWPEGESWLVSTRIRDALDHMNAHGSWVDHALGATPPDEVDQWETGTATPNHGQLARLCWLTGRPPAFYVPDGGVRSIRYGWACGRGGRGSFSIAIEMDADDGLTIRGDLDHQEEADA